MALVYKGACSVVYVVCTYGEIEYCVRSREYSTYGMYM